MGVGGILNFAPRKLLVPAGGTRRTVDMTLELEGLAFSVTRARSLSSRRTSGA